MLETDLAYVSGHIYSALTVSGSGMATKDPWDYFGIGSLAKLKLGKGLSGKIIQALMVGIVVAGALIAFVSDPALRTGLIILLLVFVYLIIDRVLIFTENNPLTAVLEGGELVKYKQIEMAGRGQPPSLPTANVAAPTTVETAPADNATIVIDTLSGKAGDDE